MIYRRGADWSTPRGKNFPATTSLPSGLASHLLGIDTPAELAKSPFQGALFEGFVAPEIVKAQANHGRRREIYYFRDEQGLEVDFLVPDRAGVVSLVECKAARTVRPADARPMQKLADAFGKRPSPRAETKLHLVFQGPRNHVGTKAISPGVQALPWQEYVLSLEE